MSKQISDEEFDYILEEVVRDAGNFIFRIPGVYEILSEHFNNDVLKIWEERQEEEDEDEDDEE